MNKLVLLGLFCFISVTAAAQDTLPRFEIGPQITQVYVPAKTVGSVTYQPAFGGIFSIAITKNFAFDSAISFTPKAPNESTDLAGGRMTQGFFGVRVGLSKGKLDLCAKVRPGVVSFGNVILTVTPPPALTFQLGRLTEPGLDVGGIVSVAIARRFAVRYDVGDMLIFYRARVVFSGRPPISSRTTNNFQFAAGFLFRF